MLMLELLTPLHRIKCKNISDARQTYLKHTKTEQQKLINHQFQTIRLISTPHSPLSRYIKKGIEGINLQKIETFFHG